MCSGALAMLSLGPSWVLQAVWEVEALDYEAELASGTHEGFLEA